MGAAMNLLTASVGSYPRIGDGHEQQAVRRAMRLWEAGKIHVGDLEEAHQQAARWAIEEQEAAGIEVVTDGLVRWYDHYSHIAGRLAGCKVDGLVRFADTNYYVREAVVEGEIDWSGPILRPEYEFAVGVAERPVKMVVTGPHTIAHHSIDRSGLYADRAELALAYAEALAQEVADLADAGCRSIQIDEPLIHQHPGWLEVTAEALGILAAYKGEATLALCLCFGDAVPLYDALQELPVDDLYLDFTYSPDLPDLVASRGSEKRLGLGLVDGRNTRLEGAEELLPILELIDGRNTRLERADEVLPLLEVIATNLDEAILAPSCGLEYLPRDRARRKLERLVEIRDAFAEVGS